MGEPSEENSFADFPPFARWRAAALKIAVIIAGIVAARVIVNLLSAVAQ
jgi:hypothetical protein